MARLITAGAELSANGSGCPDGTLVGTGIADSSFAQFPPRSGQFMWEMDNTPDNIEFNSSHGLTMVSGTTYIARFYFFVFGTNVPSTQVIARFFNNGSFLEVVTCRAIGTGTNGEWVLQLIANGTQVGSNSSVLTPTTTPWIRVDLACKIGVGSVDYCELRVNGVTVASETGASITDVVPDRFQLQNVAFPGSICIDDVAINDSSGASENTWPGDGHVVLLAPTSDNAKGTGWTNDAATTTNLFDAVNNEPPVGIADTTAGSGLHQIRNATANANVNYDANLTTYAAAGIASSDIVNVVVPVVATAAPVTTSAKLGTYGIVSNPVITNVSLGAGGTSGAFWSGVAAGTFPTGWKWSVGTTTYAPSVTVGTAPVARITQVTSSTRIAMACAMGMYVDYTPGVPVNPPRPVNVDFAVARSTSY